MKTKPIEEADAEQVMSDWLHGLSPRDPYDDLGVLRAEIVRLRTHLGELLFDRGQMFIERDRLRADNEQLCTERDKAREQAAAVDERRWAISRERDRLRAELDEWERLHPAPLAAGTVVRCNDGHLWAHQDDEGGKWYRWVCLTKHSSVWMDDAWIEAHEPVVLFTPDGLSTAADEVPLWTGSWHWGASDEGAEL